jgi:ATP-dependent DNA helicase RecG
MAKTSPITLDTPITSLYSFGVPKLGQPTARKLALALAGVAGKQDATEATVEDLLNYLPMRYEDRSNMGRISELSHGTEASLELYVRVAGGFQVGRNRSPKQPKLYIFEITASDPERTGKPVVVWWFVSGRAAERIIAYNRQRFTRGARFIAFGQWEWDSRRNTFALRLNKPDELEMLPGTWTPPEHALLRLADEGATAQASNGGGGGSSAPQTREATDEEENGPGDDADFEEEEAVDDDPATAAIHVGRRVPVYRKLGEFRTKRLREIMHAVLCRVDDDSMCRSPITRERVLLLTCGSSSRNSSGSLWPWRFVAASASRRPRARS